MRGNSILGDRKVGQGGVQESSYGRATRRCYFGEGGEGSLGEGEVVCSTLNCRRDSNFGGYPSNLGL